MYKKVFPKKVIEQLRNMAHPTDQLQDRLKKITGRPKNFLPWKRAWVDYIEAAWAGGMFDGDDGKELLARLRGVDDEGFRSAIAECFACWFFAKQLELPVSPRPQGRPGKKLEFLVQFPTGSACVEVKAPYRP